MNITKQIEKTRVALGAKQEAAADGLAWLMMAERIMSGYLETGICLLLLQVSERDGVISYTQRRRMSEQLRDQFYHLKISRGASVAFYWRKGAKAPRIKACLLLARKAV